MCKTVHGGDTYHFLMQGMQEPLDFSANLNPLGIPPQVEAAAKKGVEESNRYPDPFCRELRKAIGEKEDIDPARIVCGNGAADLIFRIVCCQKPSKALLTAPTFAEYEKALLEHDCQIKRYQLKPEAQFFVTEDILGALTEEVDLMFLCNPNNPTGQTIAAPLLRLIVEHCRKQNILLIVDECFNVFLDDSESNSLKNLLSSPKEENPHLILLNAFTKTYAMAGLRLGYALCGSKKLADRIAATGQPWSVSTPAQRAGIQALQEQEYIQKTKQMLHIEREKMRKALFCLGMKMVFGEANYLFFRLPEKQEHPLLSDAGYVSEQLQKQGILIRNCDNYVGLGAGYFRIALKLPQENAALLRALSAIKESSIK